MNECRAFSDMYIIAALLSYGYKLVRIDKSNPRRQKFFFNLDEEVDVYTVSPVGVMPTKANVDDLEMSFLSRSLLLPPRYVDSLKEIRATIHGYMEDLGGGY